MKELPIGVISGTFDPVHSGHIALAEAAIKKFSLCEIYFLPEPEPRGKKPVATLIQRKKMLSLATSYNPKFKLLNLSSQTFSVSDFEELKSIFPNKKIYLIFGSDAHAKSKTWFKPEYSETYNIYPVGLERDEIAKGVSSGKVKLGIKNGNYNQMPNSVSNYIKLNSLYSN